MPTSLTFFFALIATLGGLGTLYLGIVFIVSALRLRASPQMGVSNGDSPGTINVWVNWEPKQFAIEVYRLRFSHVSPFSETKEGTFTVTFDSPLAAPFIQPVELPTSFKNILERSSPEKSLFTIEFKTTEEKTVAKSFSYASMKKLFQGVAKTKTPTIADKRAIAKQDVATVLSLDFSELQARKKRIGALEAAAKAKAAKAAAAAPAKPVAAPVATTATPAAAPGTTETKPIDKQPEKPAAAPAKSVRDVVSASNAKQVEKP